jgi:tetratricopeptide (TPR) repeat protein
VRTVASVAPAAQEAYFKGKYELDRGTAEGYRIALDHFEDAVDEDPDFASALAGLAGARFLIGLEDPLAAQDDMALAQEEARAALALDSTSVEALDVLALINRSMPRIMEDETLLPAPNRAPKSMRVMMMPGQSDSVMIDMTVFDTVWVSAVTSLGTRIEENVRRRTMDRGEGTRRVALEARQLMTSGRYPEATEVLEALVLSAPEMVGGWEMLGPMRTSRPAMLARPQSPFSSGMNREPEGHRTTRARRNSGERSRRAGLEDFGRGTSNGSASPMPREDESPEASSPARTRRWATQTPRSGISSKLSRAVSPAFSRYAPTRRGTSYEATLAFRNSPGKFGRCGSHRRGGNR